MTTIDWQGGLPGIYRLDSAGNWVGGTLPGTADTALIDATSSGPYQLTGTLTLDAFGVVADTATLGTGSSPALVVSDGNGPLELSITGGGTLAIAPTGTVDGSGIVEVGQTATETDLLSLRGTLLAGNADLLPGGTLTVAPGAMLAGDLYMLGGTLEAVSAPGTAGGTVTLANPLHLATLSAIGALGGITLALGGGIDGASSIELFGNIVLSGPDSGTGDTTIESGAVTLAAASALGSGNLTLENGALISSLSQTLDIGGFSLAFGETGTLAAATGTTLDVVASGGGFGGTLAFGAPGEAGTVLLNPGPSGFGVNFAVDVAGGTFLDTGEFLGGHNATIAAGATFDLAGIPDLSGNTLAGTGVLTDTGAPAVFQTQGPVFAGTITGAVILEAADTTTLTGADFATQAATIFGGSTLQLGTGGGGADLTAGVLDDGALVVDRSDAATIGPIRGAGSILLDGSGTVTLTGTNTYSGDTTLESGTLLALGTIGLGTGTLTLEGGVLLATASQTMDIAALIVPSGQGGALAAATGTTLDVMASGGGFGGTLAFGAPGEAGTVLLNPGPSGFGVNFAVDVAAGTFLDTGEFLGGHNATIAAGATFDLAGIADVSGNTLAGTGVLTDSGAPAVFQTQGPVFAGTITGAVILDAADTTTLTGADFATQAATIFGGSTLQLGIGGTGPDLAAGVFDQGVLIADRSDSGTIGPLGGGGTFIQEGSGTITLDGVNSITGNLTLEAGTLALAASGAAGGAGIVFAGHANLVVQDAAFAGSPADATLTNPITGFVPGTTIDLPGLPFADGVTADLAGGTLTASGGGDSFALNIVGGPSSGMLLTAPDGSGGTEIIACFAAGTRIATTHGEIPVEQLREGDLVWTASGRLAPITWLGHRRLVPRRLADPETVMPVRIRAGAFADSVPLRDILLSPDHAVLVAGRLIPVRHLVNGATIRREKVASITYWHVELAAHDVLLAEGLPCETYLDTGNRAAFANAGTVVLATPEFARAIWVLGGCAELAPSGSPVEHARAILTARAQALGWRLRRARLTVRADGRILCAERLGAAWRVELPPGTRQIRLVSEAAVPAETEGADDRRRLGIAIAGLVLDNAELMPGDPRFTEGWHSPEPFGQWTNGNAALDVTLARHLSFRQTRMATIWKQGGKSRFGSFSTEKEHTSCA
jgi:autotransporter-associated beta strand protein